MFNFIKSRKYYYAVSGVLVIVSILSLSVWGLNLGIDFTGGSLMEVAVPGEESVTQSDVKTAVAEEGIEVISVQPAGERNFIVRMPSLTEVEHQQALAAVKGRYGEDVTELRFESIGPTIGQELKTKAITAIVLVLGAIIIYIAIAFRKVSYPVASWKYGLSAIIALVHDVVIIVGVYSVLGHFYGFQVDTLFVTALLTIMGFSVHDSIVTFDRTRENLHVKQHLSFKEIVNVSIIETLVRSINTSMTTLVVLVAIFLFGGSSIQQFALTLVLGIFIGTYSSIFIASPLLVEWYRLRKR
ncbi:MAG: protein translocase subunit SecF [Candidatus Komeilibacteria bacterium]|nr:protein translocase subunit SecF [Candidatus Komeilibacteria bacterium]